MYEHVCGLKKRPCVETLPWVSPDMDAARVCVSVFGCGSCKLVHQCPGCCRFASLCPSFLPSPHPTSSASSIFFFSLLLLLHLQPLPLHLPLHTLSSPSSSLPPATPPPLPPLPSQQSDQPCNFHPPLPSSPPSLRLPSFPSPSRLPSSALVGWPLPDIKVKSLPLPLPLLCLSFFPLLFPHSLRTSCSPSLRSGFCRRLAQPDL